MRLRSIFITGTDTGVGKTHVSCSLLAAFAAQGLVARGMKPVASGCSFGPGGWRNGDAEQLQHQSTPPWPDYSRVNPFALPEPTAPEIAARHAGMKITLPALVDAHAVLAQGSDIVIVEGAGGWRAPLTATFDQADLVRAIGARVLLVVALRLGCINHARLSEQVILEDGMDLAGWVSVRLDPELRFAEETLQLLRIHLQSPFLADIPHAPGTVFSAMKLPAQLY